ncbi:pyruvate dehydrogenase E2 component (dihydrolipoamide acetyltransferase) [Salirhabdus euzebyi]|uniref:Pyruvate dehydrogenase E2 component (Dihydrolipoamide acetyltransferase) n=1 Tax=Salirhabdus euzebyi TaxID=394506 RepID=A0A841Q5S5_9BACI|nr:alpha/beta hydrolase [Salirhabdus euzebyi]MBB6453707.1 pyruvate dehydrogenase E2 component (dihydrolipoamide acetyltransferase) [Salirhabdus euzebyi]
MPYLIVNNTRIYYEEFSNEGPTLLLIHGAAQDTLSWRFNTIFLVELGFHVIAIDLPGHGKSQLAPSGPIDNLEDYAFYTEKFMDTLNIKNYSVMGHSMAGGIGLYMALHKPESISMLVIVDGAAYTSGTYGEDVFELVSINPTDWFEVNFRTICSPTTDIARVEEIAFDVRRCSPEVAFNDIRAYAALDLRDKMKEIKVPLIAIHGEDDWSIPSEIGKKTVEMSSGNFHFELLKNVGHFPHTESPELFNQAFKRVLEKIPVKL